VVQKQSAYRILNKTYYILLKLASDIRFFHQIKSTLILSVDVKYSVHDLICDINCCARPAKLCNWCQLSILASVAL